MSTYNVQYGEGSGQRRRPRIEETVPASPPSLSIILVQTPQFQAQAETKTKKRGQKWVPGNGVQKSMLVSKSDQGFAQ